MIGTTLGNGEVQHDIEDLLNFKQIRIDDKTKRDNHTTADVEFMHVSIINEHNKGLDDLMDQEELGGDECDVEEEIDIDCSTKDNQFRQLIEYWKHPTIQNHQNSGETTDDEFGAVFGKKQPDLLRCYGRLVTKSSLKKDEDLTILNKSMPMKSLF
ncbi:hypothetical protein RDI58_001044 [Solanum bulbocastanum]|uniref:Uncharacterized protein n=1 Tax=Solanum bulbocastanum TaxID=147425 RepID=A0AAN8UBT6_SOLBU